MLFVGFQANGTLGRALIEGADKVKLFGETIHVAAEITQLPGISGHGDSAMLIKWVTHFSPKPKRVFVNHGESAVCDLFAKRLSDEFGLSATSPFSGSVYDLIQNAYVLETRPVPVAAVEKRFIPAEVAEQHEARPFSPKAAQARTAYEKLLAALERLTNVIKRSKGRSDLQLRSVASELDAISNAWERE